MKKLQKILSYSLALMLTFSVSMSHQSLVYAQEDMGQEQTYNAQSPITHTEDSIRVSEMGIVNTTTNMVVAHATITTDSLMLEVVMPEDGVNTINLKNLRILMANGVDFMRAGVMEQIAVEDNFFTASRLDNGHIQITVPFEREIGLSDLLFIGLSNIPVDITDMNDIDMDTLISVQIYTEITQLQPLIDANMTGVDNAGLTLSGWTIQNRRDEFESDADFVNHEAFALNINDRMREDIRVINESVTMGSTTLTLLSALSTDELINTGEHTNIQTTLTFSIQDDNIMWNADNPWSNAVAFTTAPENSFPRVAQGIFVNEQTNTAYFRADIGSWNTDSGVDEVMINIQIQDLASNRMDTTIVLDVNLYEILMAHTPTFGSQFQNRGNRGGSTWGSPEIDNLITELGLMSSMDFEQFFAELKEDELSILLAEGIYLSNIALVGDFLTVQVKYTEPATSIFRDVNETEMRLNFWDMSGLLGEGPGTIQLRSIAFSDGDNWEEETPYYEDFLFFVRETTGISNIQGNVSMSAFETLEPVSVFADFTSPVVPRSISRTGANFSYPLEVDGMSLEMRSLMLSPNGISFDVTPNAELTENTNFLTNARSPEMVDFFTLRLLDADGNDITFVIEDVQFFENEWQTSFWMSGWSTQLDFMAVSTVIINNTEINMN